MSKNFNNVSGTTSPEFTIGVGGQFGANVRHIVLRAQCLSGDYDATDKNGNEIIIKGTEFFDLKMLATDEAGNIATKQIRGTITEGSTIKKITDTFEEEFNGNVLLSLDVNTLHIKCVKGNAVSAATYNIYISLQRIETAVPLELS